MLYFPWNYLLCKMQTEKDACRQFLPWVLITLLHIKKTRIYVSRDLSKLLFLVFLSKGQVWYLKMNLFTKCGAKYLCQLWLETSRFHQCLPFPVFLYLFLQQWQDFHSFNAIFPSLCFKIPQANKITPHSQTPKPLNSNKSSHSISFEFFFYCIFPYSSLFPRKDTIDQIQFFWFYACVINRRERKQFHS